MMSERPVRAQLDGCEDRLVRARGYLNVLAKAIALDEVRGRSDGGSHGYSDVLETVEALLVDTLEAVEAVQSRIQRRDGPVDAGE